MDAGKHDRQMGMPMVRRVLLLSQAVARLVDGNEARVPNSNK